MFVDGATVPLIYHFGGLRSVIPVGMLDSIEFFPGNFSPMYGRATGGIIDVQLKKLQPPKIGGYADVSILDTGVYLEVPLGNKGGIAVAGRRSYIDFIIEAAVPDDAPVNLVTAPRATTTVSCWATTARRRPTTCGRSSSARTTS